MSPVKRKFNYENDKQNSNDSKKTIAERFSKEIKNSLHGRSMIVSNHKNSQLESNNISPNLKKKGLKITFSENPIRSKIY